MKVIYPSEKVQKEDIIIFLAGPIQGARNWQKEASEIIEKLAKENNILDKITIASPRWEHLSNKVDYETQVDWETEYLNKASKTGVILFWLEKEQEHYCDRAYAQTTRFELAEWKAYAQTTRFELAEWKVKHQLLEAKIVLGIDEKFTNRRYITRRFSQDCPDVNICMSLEDTCKEAIDVVVKNLK